MTRMNTHSTKAAAAKAGLSTANGGREACRKCNLVERFFGKFTFRGVATRYDQPARNLLSTVHLSVSRFHASPQARKPVIRAQGAGGGECTNEAFFSLHPTS